MSRPGTDHLPSELPAIPAVRQPVTTALREL